VTCCQLVVSSARCPAGARRSSGPDPDVLVAALCRGLRRIAPTLLLKRVREPLLHTLIFILSHDACLPADVAPWRCARSSPCDRQRPPRPRPRCWASRRGQPRCPCAPPTRPRPPPAPRPARPRTRPLPSRARARWRPRTARTAASRTQSAGAARRGARRARLWVGAGRRGAAVLHRWSVCSKVCGWDAGDLGWTAAALAAAPAPHRKHIYTTCSLQTHVVTCLHLPSCP